ncbi:N-carbamoyl-L-amino-acid hydrolase [Halohasta litchfieldiae]|jgi:N-carbamoyl-L-amino-acid hydrolase|uniref:N-carbamoyl-L-amino-acid hydrolase n=1 Tax=Halohasta litchfieldiae TaxID=1073996 RepID=A0A1H6S1N2_9EURY|nr:Zn-dependent hydrolase [Halohasta litchfieldiae]ATW89338.1 N-carbamoyl-L-amino-acid hydrolase [Halohasta litchfieldiae]SEI59744.1 N-carbamoyl-L-amino-acid hydrolase [Halohasta litchfieldiae]
MTESRFPVDGDRLQQDIERNAQFGTIATENGRGRTVLPGTTPNQQARESLVERLIFADLTVDTDAVGNITGTWLPEGCDPEAPPVAVGSHLDSVPNGGIFDGPLGVYAALEAVRALQDADVSTTRPIQVVCFTGEEGTRFADGVLGSSVAAGLLDIATALELSDGTETLREALEDIGFHGEGRLDATDWHAWLELHVEQSQRLEQLDVSAGVVTTINGTTRLHGTIEGTPEHTGSTSMADRTDALAAASEFVLAVEQAAQAAAETDPTAVATVGELSVDPGAVNVVPGQVEFSVDIRAVNQSVIDRLVDRAESKLEALEADRGVETTLDCSYDVSPADMAPSCRAALHDAGDALGIETVDVHSGAGHDTMQIATATDAGLLFAPSRGGHSHNPLEWTDWWDCAAATEVLTEALYSLATNGADT